MQNGQQGIEAMFVSMAHSDEDIEKTCKVIESYKG